MRLGDGVEIETVERTPKIAVGGLFAVSTGFDDAIVAEITQRPERHIVVFDRRPFLRCHDGIGTPFGAALRGREQAEGRVIRQKRNDIVLVLIAHCERIQSHFGVVVAEGAVAGQRRGKGADFHMDAGLERLDQRCRKEGHAAALGMAGDDNAFAAARLKGGERCLGIIPEADRGVGKSGLDAAERGAIDRPTGAVRRQRESLAATDGYW